MTSCHSSPPKNFFMCTVYSYENNIENKLLERLFPLFFRLAEELSEKLLNMTNKLVNTSGIMDDIQALLDKLLDLQRHSNESKKQSDEVFTLISGISRMQNSTMVRL